MKSLGNKGFSLVELMVAIALLAISGTVLFYGFVTSGRIHLNTSQLQMSEDVAQYISEEFKSHSVDWLISRYSGVKTTSGIVDTITFTGIPYEYEVEAATGREDAKFTANITLTSKVNDDGNETARNTTYKQNKDVTYFYEVADTVGTNTFIIPEITNIYDGKSVVISNEINQYDGRVVSDLWFAIHNDIAAKNALIPLEANKFNTNAMDSEYTSRYHPLTNISSSNALKKSTDIKVIETSSGDSVNYSYVVTVKYTFNFDFNLSYKSGLLGPSLSSTVAAGELATVEGAESTYSVNHSGTKYVVTYSRVLDESLTGRPGVTGSFAGVMNVEGESGAPSFEYKSDGTGDKIANLYILYTPFDLYSDSLSGVANDEITFNFEGSLNTNIVRVFFVVQELPHMLDPDLLVTVPDCDIDSGDPAIFKVYTNSADIIDNAFNNFEGTNYLTNSYGKSHVNFYDMKIEVFDKDGNKAAEINTVKED